MGTRWYDCDQCDLLYVCSVDYQGLDTSVIFEDEFLFFLIHRSIQCKERQYVCDQCDLL